MSAEFAAFAIIGILFFVIDRVYSFIKKDDGPSYSESEEEINTSQREKEVNDDDKDSPDTSNTTQRPSRIKRFFRILYPKVDHSVLWHRIVTGVGMFLIGIWILMGILSAIYDSGYRGGTTFADLATVFFFIFLAYFTIVQRIIYFMAYGDKKYKWQVNQQRHEGE